MPRCKPIHFSGAPFDREQTVSANLFMVLTGAIVFMAPRIFPFAAECACEVLCKGEAVLLSTVSNRLLEALPPASRSMMHSLLEPVSLPIRMVCYEPDTVPRHVYFVTSGMVSLVTTLSSGEVIEIGLVGREGMAGSLHLIGSSPVANRAFVQIPGTALRMEYKRFEAIFQENPDLHQRVLKHVQYTILILSQLAACNSLHNMEERLARWLLMVADRIESSEIPTTQEFLASMLGTRRSTVTLTAGTLQRAGLIDYRRGQIRILDRENLESSACECYSATRLLLQAIY